MFTDQERAERDASDRERAERHNRELFAKLADAKNARGYAAMIARGEKIHAGTQVTQGHSGFKHPRPFCMPATSLVYGSLTREPSSDEITCKRCLASIAKRGL
jgi:hypothetical protein